MYCKKCYRKVDLTWVRCHCCGNPINQENVTNDENSFEADGMSKQDEAILLRSELGMAIACKEKINPEKYLRAQELGLLPALQGLASLCEVEINDLVKK